VKKPGLTTFAARGTLSNGERNTFARLLLNTDQMQNMFANVGRR
jgi:hypothetical protein